MSFLTSHHVTPRMTITANIPKNTAPTGKAPLPGETIQAYEKRMKHTPKAPTFVKDQNTKAAIAKAHRISYILREVSDGRRFTARDAHKMIPQCSRETAHGYVNDLVGTGDITRIAPTSGNCGAVYQLTSAVGSHMVTRKTKGRKE